MMTDKLLDLIARHECLGGKPNLTAYQDTEGIWTIGYGHNLTKPIRATRLRDIFEDDVQDAINECVHAFPWFMELSEDRQHAMIDLMFNLGLPRFLKFKNFLKAMSLGDYETAHDELLDSDAGRKLKSRYTELANMIRGSESV